MGQWKADLVRNIFYPVDADIILKIKLSSRQEEDVVAWNPECSGSFSVRSAYRLGFNELPDQRAFPASSAQPDGTDLCWRRIWKSKVPPKVKMFAWKAASNCLATEENKRIRHLHVTGQCNICNAPLEDVCHALYACPHASNLWASMRQCWCLPSDTDLRISPRNWFRSVLISISENMVDATLLVAWRAWYVRNEVTHFKPLPPIEGSKHFLEGYSQLFHDARKVPAEAIIKGKTPALAVGNQRVVASLTVPNKPWLKPPLGSAKLSIDGSFLASDQTAGAGMVLRDENGMPIFSSCKFLEDCSSPLESELRACVEGLKLAVQHSELPILVETDCRQLVSMATSKERDRSSLLHLVSELKFLCSSSRVCSIVKVERSQIRVSHHLANLARVERRSEFWLDSGPVDILQLLEQDRSVTLSDQ
jgi:ribonuclease HI